MSALTNEAAVRRFVDAFVNADDTTVLEELVAPDYTFHVPGIAGIVPGPTAGRETWLRRRATLHAAFPDLRLQIDDLLTAGEKVVLRYHGHGTHSGPYAGVAPTHKAVSYSGILIFRFQEGRMVEEWAEADILGLLRQIGAIPTPERP